MWMPWNGPCIMGILRWVPCREPGMSWTPWDRPCVLETEGWACVVGILG